MVQGGDGTHFFAAATNFVILVPHLAQVPCIIARPLEATDSFGSFISPLALHFTQ